MSRSCTSSPVPFSAAESAPTNGPPQSLADDFITLDDYGQQYVEWVSAYESSCPAPGAGFSAGFSAIATAVVSSSPATLAAFWRAVRTT